MSNGAGDPVQYWFNTRTGKVEKGQQSSWEHLMGPYPTAEEAAGALEIAKHRNESWDDDDDVWRGKDG
ncbi:SPOR domain-containing protein [Demequina gelatinilytica]|uniref:SPOR domain-containing protein n=1 Tax=Demequina gelatinilytica TaxID=1638980 RepID=UPI000AE1E1F4|nr:SPOR domain-containing protein [Demequina gelatinilytica]